jgi:Holliday junction DNA helicase RuvA
MDAVAFARCVGRNDVNALVALPGVGKKTAERLIVEMRDRLGDWLSQLSAPGDTDVGASSLQVLHDPIADAESALVALGYKPQEASRLVQSVAADESLDSETLIRLALRSTVSK